MTTKTEVTVQSDLAVPPGELIDEELRAIGMTRRQFAARTGRPVQAISEIIHGKKSITPDTAIEFERVLGISARVWLNLEANFQLTRAHQREEQELRVQEERLQEFPVAAMERLGWIQRASTKEDKVRQLLNFFGVASFAAWQSTVTGFRVPVSSPVSIGALAAWIRKAELEGLAIRTEPYDRSRFRAMLKQIRAVAAEPAPIFDGRMQEHCAALGVAFVVIPQLPRSCATGFARWLRKDKALIALSPHDMNNDQFWFGFFHEACHILAHAVNATYIDGVGRGADTSIELEADRFAADFLSNELKQRIVLVP